MSPAPVDLAEFVGGYLAEAEELLRTANASLVAIDEATKRGEPSPRAVRELFRALHTIKGLSAMVGVEPIVELAHAMESALKALERVGAAPSGPAIEALLDGVKAIATRVGAVAERKQVGRAPARLLDALARLEPEKRVEAQRASIEGLDPGVLAKLGASEREQLVRGVGRGARAFSVDFVPTPALATQGISITTVRERVAAIGELVKVVPVPMPRDERSPGGLKFALVVLTGKDAGEVASAASTTTDAVTPIEVATANGDEEESDLALRPQSRVIRVDVARLDDAMEHLSSLVVNGFRLRRAIADLAARGVDVRALREIAQEGRQQLRDMRASILQLRMVSVAELLEPIPLVVRGLRGTTGKAVRVELDGGRAEIDKSVGERILPAIVHLVRNAIDHGIETLEERRAAGKPDDGVLRIRCVQRSHSQLELVVSDDGRGVDAVQVARRAGRVLPTTDAELLDLLTIPGMSTREHATTTSGRGVGMDVVKRIVDQLGGELHLANSPGQGASFTLRVPLTVTVLDAFSCECGGQPFVVPVASIEEIVEVEPARVVRGPSLGSKVPAALLERRGEAVPLFDLDAVFTLPAAPDAAKKALVVRRGTQAYAFGVDRMTGQHEVVVRPIVDPLVSVVGVTGSTDLGDGRPVLVLDLVALSASLSRKEIAA